MLENLQSFLGSEDNYSQVNDKLLYTDVLNHIAKQQYKINSIPPDVAYRYQGNFYGLLATMLIPASLYLYTLYLNEYLHPHEYDGKTYTIRVPTEFPTPF